MLKDAQLDPLSFLSKLMQLAKSLFVWQVTNFYAVLKPENKECLEKSKEALMSACEGVKKTCLKYHINTILREASPQDHPCSEAKFLRRRSLDL